MVDAAIFQLISYGLFIVIILLSVLLIFARHFVMLPVKAFLGKKKGALLCIGIGRDRNVIFDVITPDDGKTIKKVRSDGLEDIIDIDGKDLFFTSALGIRLAFIMPDSKHNVDPFSEKGESLTAPRLRNMMRIEREIGASQSKKNDEKLARYVTFTFFIVLGIMLVSILTFMGVGGLEDTLTQVVQAAVSGAVKSATPGGVVSAIPT